MLSLADAAAELGLSQRVVRRMAARGDLRGSLIGGRWLLDEESVRHAARGRPSPGRPWNATTAWTLLAALTRASAAVDESAHDAARSFLDRRTFHRVKRFLLNQDPGTAWTSALRRRGTRKRVWIHPGVLDAFLSDRRVVLGGAHALAAAGVDLAPGGRALAYVREADLEDLRSRFHFEDAEDGEVDLVVIPAAVPESLTPQGLRQPPLAASAVDLLDDPDARARAAAEAWLRSIVDETVRPAGGPR